jgi:hypothetical protein
MASKSTHKGAAKPSEIVVVLARNEAAVDVGSVGVSAQGFSEVKLLRTFRKMAQGDRDALLAIAEILVDERPIAQPTLRLVPGGLSSRMIAHTGIPGGANGDAGK